jgi:hypothetical protein
MSSMTIRALLQSPRYTCQAVNVREGVSTHTLPDINSLKNAIRQEIANVTQDTLRRVMASVPGRWQQCLDCHGGHLQDVVLKT